MLLGVLLNEAVKHAVPVPLESMLMEMNASSVSQESFQMIQINKRARVVRVASFQRRELLCAVTAFPENI